MSCYFRHTKDILDQAGIEVIPGNRKQIDQIIHPMVNATYKDRPDTWKRLKQQIIGNEQKRRDLVKRLHDTIR